MSRPVDADVRFWTAAELAAESMPVGTTLNVLDVRGNEPGRVPAGAGLLLVGSEPAFGAWARYAEDVPIAVVPAAVVVSGEASGAFRTLLLIAGRDADALAERAADWARAQNMACGLADAAGARGLALLARIGPPPASADGIAMLDLRRGSDRVELPAALLSGLAQGAPLLFLEDTPARCALERCGAAFRLDGLEPGLDAFTALPNSQRRAISESALSFVRERHDAGAARETLDCAIRFALQRMRDRTERWAALGPDVHVLVVSDEAPNLLDIRVHRPFAAMRRRGAIKGYTVLRHGDVGFTTAPVTPSLRFGAIWVQRSVDPLTQLLLRLLGRPYVYDLDDNLLVSPSYRPPFPAESIAAARGLIQGCAVLSCATPRLAGLLAAHSGSPLAAKTVVTPNLAEGDATPAAGAPRSIVWASSDRPALTGSGAEIARAVRDVCLAHGLTLLCIGAEPHAALVESGVSIERVGLLSYPAYLARLRAAAPGVMVGPLETGADRATQDFVDGKSDIKVIEARAAGLVGVFSRAAPYLDSELAPAILCDNTYDSWLAGLERALLRCRAPEPPAPIPPLRDADGLGPMPWAEALRRAGTDMAMAEVTDAVRTMRGQAETVLAAPTRFDEADYLQRHPDVRAAVDAGIVASGYRHYVASGFREGRLARLLPSPGDEGAFWWTRLLQTVDRLEISVAARETEIDALRDRVTLRRLRPARAAALPGPGPHDATRPASEAAPDARARWHPGGALDEPCPVCEAAGPHPLLLETEGHRLARCSTCRSCFYADRTPYRYEHEPEPDVLLQLYLEQNAGIYHQTQLLFALEGVDSVLDVGCGFGFAVDMAATMGWRATGIDPSFYAGEGAATLGANIRQAYLTAETEFGTTYSLVMASEVIEHVAEPHAFLAWLRAALAPGGTLVLTTPDAAALAPGIAAARLTGILAVRVHLILFTRDSLALGLQRAGFRHVQVEAAEDGLVAYASDRPLRFRADAGQRHLEHYRAYLEALLGRVEPATPLWNGAAGRLFTLLAPASPLPEVLALFARIAAVWRARFAIDLARLRLPELLDEAALASATPALLASGQPLNLAPVLLSRALLEQRTPGHTPESVLAYARPAHLHAVQTGRVLQRANMIDLDLRRTAWQARLLIADCLAALAPELEGDVLRGVAEPGSGALAEWTDPPEDALVARIAPAFSARVQADRFDEARSLEPWVRDGDRLRRALADRPEELLRALFALGVQRLIGERDPAAALDAFERMAAEARSTIDRDPVVGREFLRLAQEHVQLAAARIKEA